MSIGAGPVFNLGANGVGFTEVNAVGIIDVWTGVV